MQEGLLLKRALIVLEHCLKLKKNESCLILTDESIEPALLKAVSAAAIAIGADTQTMSYTPKKFLAEREYCQFTSGKEMGETVPQAVTAALGASDCAVAIESDLYIYFSPNMKKVLQKGVRIISLSGIHNKERFLRLMPETPQHIETIKSTTEIYRNFLANTQDAHLTTPAGTDLKVSLHNHQAFANKGVVDDDIAGGFLGGMELLPAGQAFIVPDKGSACGTIVIDRGIAGFEFNRVYEPIRMTVEDGYVKDIFGGREANLLRRFMESFGNKEIFNVTELSIGTNSQCKFPGLVAPAEDTHSSGHVNIAFGNDTHLGGTTIAPCHIDATMYETSLCLDGKLVVEAGRLLKGKL